MQPVDIQPQCTCKKSQLPTNVSVTTNSAAINKQTKTPTEKQLASRAAFKNKVDEAKRLQSEQPGLSYKQAIKSVYGKQ